MRFLPYRRSYFMVDTLYIGAKKFPDAAFLSRTCVVYLEQRGTLCNLCVGQGVTFETAFLGLDAYIAHWLI